MKIVIIGTGQRLWGQALVSLKTTQQEEAQKTSAANTMYTGHQRGRQLMMHYQKNELEMVLDICEKLLQDKTGGVIFNKGTDIESKLSYKQALEGIKSLRYYFGLQGSFSFSICKSCRKWNNVGHGNKVFGTCPKGDMKHEYETCAEHTKNKEAWGL